MLLAMLTATQLDMIAVSFDWFRFKFRQMAIVAIRKGNNDPCRLRDGFLMNTRKHASDLANQCIRGCI